MCLKSLKCHIHVRFGWMLGLLQWLHLIPPQFCHLRIGKIQKSLCAPSKEWGRLLRGMRASKPEEQKGGRLGGARWRGQLRLRGSGSQERAGGIESVSVRTDHEFQQLWTLATHAIRTPLTRQGTPCETNKDPKDSRKATSSHCQENISHSSPWEWPRRKH